ncbi:hypothetical protein L228DRAFT_14502 [Xylona heveae TC161]|uniref:Uncharacterized protein n=1 Tax=Xylona heveae (strain CBS 132557 / TC161) TaxID=1328760 RepID=A0A165JQX7_XYLHT|nr:hypothetical protein L228DRAFT_14502 [Xylona heveae TC161]KZF26525.1 hypothetical protein L228DRAFT_14502 [Xylona heveae TC161]
MEKSGTLRMYPHKPQFSQFYRAFCCHTGTIDPRESAIDICLQLLLLLLLPIEAVIFSTCLQSTKAMAMTADL